MIHSPAPYVSIAFVNRNDGYGGTLEERIAKFIEYYGHYAERWPGLFEFVICDWNPPEASAKLRDAFDWRPLRNVLHVEVPPEVHDRVAGEKGRKMLDYIGRNVALRRGSGVFSLILNQDIFVSGSILEEISRRRLSPRYFYRADRCDFDFTPCMDLGPEEFEAGACAAMFEVHRRHRSDGEEISVKATPKSINLLGSRLEAPDELDDEKGLILCDVFGARLVCDRDRAKRWDQIPHRHEELAAWREGYLSKHYYGDFLLHTNASGDFILAPRQAFFDICGMEETTEYYMHLDTCAIMQLFAAGYNQAIFAQPHRVYHADHDRSARSDFQEQVSWSEHEMSWSQILRREKSYRLNDHNWGLGAEDLPTERFVKS